MADFDSMETADVLAALRSLLPELKERYGVVSVELFGSFVRSQQRLDSDIDLLVEFDDPPSLLTFLALERELSERLERPVDLVQKEAVQRRIGRAIRAEAVAV